MTHYYVTILRGKRVGYLLGPYASEAEARERIPDARRIAEQVDPATVFDAFGVTGVTGGTGAPGALQGGLGQ